MATAATSHPAALPDGHRPSLGPRQPSTTMIVPADHPEIECKSPRTFPPGDARAMSPRASNENLQQMCGESRDRLHTSTMAHQSSLAALIERIESVKSGHEKLERDNHALQEYIGGLTRSMSNSTTGSGLSRTGTGAGASVGAGGGIGRSDSMSRRK